MRPKSLECRLRYFHTSCFRLTRLRIQVLPVRYTSALSLCRAVVFNCHAIFLQCVQKPVQPLENTGSMESMETKEHKLLQDQAQRQSCQTPDACPSARRAKRMKCEVGCCWRALHTPSLFSIHHIFPHSRRDFL